MTLTNKQVKGTQGRSIKTKSVVLGLVERGGCMNAYHIPDTRVQTLKKLIQKRFKAGALLMTDEYRSYGKAVVGYERQTVNHGAGQFVDGKSHVNTLVKFELCQINLISIVVILPLTNKERMG